MISYNITSSNIYMSDYSRLALTCMYLIIFLVGIIGNIKLIRLLMISKNISVLPFLNLGIADLLFVIFIPLYIVYILSNFHWPFGKALCKISSFFFTSNMFASIFLITLINIYRYTKTSLPGFTYKYVNIRNMYLTISSIWIISIMLGIPALYYRDIIVTKSNYTLCINHYHEDIFLAEFIHKVMICIRFTIGYLMPMLIIILCYVLLIYNTNRLADISDRILFISISASIVFFICWTPHHIINIITLIGSKNQALRSFVKEAAPIFAGFGCVYSAINPIMYILVIRFLNSYSDDDTYELLRETLIDENESKSISIVTDEHNDIEINDISHKDYAINS